MTPLDRRSFLTFLASVSALSLCEAAEFTEDGRDRVYQQLLAEYKRGQAEFSKEMTRLAEDCEAAGLSSDAAHVRELAEPVSGQSLSIDDLPETIRPEISSNFPPEQRTRLVRLRTLEDEYAANLFQQSIRARQKGQISLAWRLVRETAFHNSDHEKARALLGYVKLDNAWTTPFRRQMLKSGKVWHDRFGWLLESHVSRYEKGERNYNGRWMAADREASLRTDFRNAWVAESEHFLVKTNHSLERAVEITVQLEKFHDYFLHTFAAVFMSPQQIQQLFEGGLSGRPQIQKRHEVYYFRDRKEFVEELMPIQPEAAISYGIYLPKPRPRSYFFHKPNEVEVVEETLYHETTHQILSESVRRPIAVGEDANFWLVEGLACYLESFKPEAHGGTVGDPGHVRILWARKYLAEELEKYVPMAQFTSMGQRDFQCMGMVNDVERTKQLQHYYAQSAGVTHFFLHYNDGVYREALVTHLAQIYSPDQRVRKKADSLADLTGVDFKELDRQYVEYMRNLP